MKTIAAILGLVLSVTTIARADESVVQTRRRGLGCQIAVHDGMAYLTVLGTISSGVKHYRVPKMVEIMDWMESNPGLFSEINSQREAGKIETWIEGEAGKRWFSFNSQPSRTQRNPRCPARFANGYDCFDYMIKQGRSKNADGSYNEWRLAEGINSEFWLTSKAEDSAAIETIARKMNCVQIRREIPTAAATESAAPAAEAPVRAAPVPSRSSASAPTPTRVSDVLPSNDPNVDVAVGARRQAPMDLAPSPGATSAAAPRAASN